MRQRLNFWVMGGDPRLSALARSLAGDGHTVHTYALEEGVDPALRAETLDGAGEADCVVLPLPAAQGGSLNAPLCPSPPPLGQVLDALAPGQVVCAGRVSPELELEAERRGVRLIDYFQREELAVANAVPASLAVSPRRITALFAPYNIPVPQKGGVIMPTGTDTAALLGRIRLGLLREALRRKLLTEAQFAALTEPKREG